MTYVYGWAAFALLSPALGFCTWYAKGNGIIPKIIIAGIILVIFASAIILFDRIRVADVFFAILTGFVLLKK